MVYLGVITLQFLIIILFIIGYTAFNTWGQVYGIKRYKREVSKKLFRTILVANLIMSILFIIIFGYAY